MDTAKKILIRLPEYYLIILSFLSGYSPPFSLHPLAAGVMGILVLQLTCKNRISGLVIAGLFLLINLYMFLALLSEFSEFQGFNANARPLLLGGLSLLVLNAITSFFMIFRYTKIAKSSHQG